MNGPAQPKRILIVEDVQVVSQMIEKILADEDFEISVAVDGEQCLELVPKLRPDLIIMDLMMPKVNGLEALSRLRADPETCSVGVIVCSAKDFKTEIQQALELGAFAFMTKPFRRQELIDLVRRYFAHAAPEEHIVPEPRQQPAVAYAPELRVDNGIFRLWGTRGSIPISGSPFVRHGGNTSCLEIEYGDERVIIDAGSGIRDLGNSLLPGGPRKLHIFITHTHWDHIQGFPFFTPVYIPGYEITLYASPNLDKDLKSIFQGQLDRAYFPVQMEDMRANLDFVHLGEGPLRIGDIEISWDYTLHPSPTLGYRIAINGKSLAYVTDNEFLKGHVGSPEEAEANSELKAINEKIVRFLSDADVLIHEAQYTPQEYPQKIGWGHTSLPNGCLLAKWARPGRWIVTHHDPDHDDRFLQNKLNLTRQLLRQLDCDLEVEHAYDGMQIYL